MANGGVLCVASCGKAKIWKTNPHAGPTKAKDVYIGSYAKCCVDYAKKFYPSSWCVLSAKHGFLLPEDIVPEDYNITFSDKRCNPITIDKLRQQAAEKNLKRFKRVVIIAGKSYAKMATQVFQDAAIITPLEGYGGNVSQANVLAKAIKTGIPLDGKYKQ